MNRLSALFFAVLAVPSLRGAAAQGAVAGVVRGRDGVVADAAVFLVPVGPAPQVQPTRARIDQSELQFVPRLVVVTPGSTVEFPNSDPVMHNVFHPGNGARGFDLGTYPRAEARAFTFAEEGMYVMLCHVHPEMVGYVVVVASEYRAATTDDGRFRFDSVPAGDYRLHVWHRRSNDPDMAVTVHKEGTTTVSPLLTPVERRRSPSPQ